MSPISVTISPHDPLLVRDGRPFGAGGESGNRARSVDWPYPSTVAGAIRTLIGKLMAPEDGRNPFHDERFLARLKGTAVVGPLPVAAGELYVPAPRDALAHQDESTKAVYWDALRPERPADGAGCDLPAPGLCPVRILHSEKPPEMPGFWSLKSALTWLGTDRPEMGFQPVGLPKFVKDERTHVRIDPARGTAAEAQLFSTEGLVFPDVDLPVDGERAGESGRRLVRPAVSLAAQVGPADDEIAARLAGLDALHPLGGERRLARFRFGDAAEMWQGPRTLRDALAGADGFRMVLATPAIFAGGWLPGWLKETDNGFLEGTPPGAPFDLRLRLRGACVERWRPVSGWSLERGQRGPKAVRRVVPGGSVYFFEKVSGSGSSLADLWLRPVSDGDQDRRDGFGAALWGVWRNDCDEGGMNK